MKLVSDKLFAFQSVAVPVASHERCSAEDLGLPESWFRDAIFQSPELVIGPCRAAGLTDDEWYSWRKEFPTEVGPIDVLLVSSSGRLAVVETKLASNSDLRRKVLAQALDYLAHLPGQFEDSMPEIPEENEEPVAEADDIREAVSQGDVLVIIASDEVDTRVAKLSRNLLSDHLVKQWDLALVDLALYRPREGASGQCFIVPHVRNFVAAERRQVVRVIVQGESPTARVEVERVDVDGVASGRQRWDENRFFESLGRDAPPAIYELAIKLRELASRFPESVTLTWGTGRVLGSMVLKRNGSGLIEVYGSGEVRFRISKFVSAFGQDGAREYGDALDQIVPGITRQRYPGVPPIEAAKIAPALFDLVRNAIEKSSAPRPDAS